MKVVARYNPITDVMAVDQTGFVDLVCANAESSIPAVLPLSEEHYNGIDDPNSIGFRPGDEFEAAQAAKAITGYKPAVKDEAPKE